ncbi:hypothetical protein BaRGS_00017152 [Batillaria attramentaria]|uniref:MYND-type domain-containing protein n=1 Tax=Batillaria attramentaria TaxID=370345 RepID=A0ABD0KWT6_9CAEN
MGWKRGDIVMKSEPYTHVLSNKLRITRCSYCLQRKEELKRCTACSLLRYCGRECQRKDGLFHRMSASVYQRVMPNTPTDSVLLMLRLFIKYMAGEHTKTVDGDPGLRTFQTLMSHTEEVKNDPDRCDVFSKICHTLTLLAGPELQLPTTAILLEIFGKMVINTFTIADEELQDIGSGVYLSPATLDHRCRPNAVMSFQGRSLYVRAVEDIPDGDTASVSDHVFLNYVDQLALSWERQKQLQQQYYFLCTCARCSDAALDELMTAENWSASCQAVVDNVEHLKTSGEDPHKLLSLCKECLARVEGRLSPYNVYRLRVLDRALDAAICCGLWEDALSYGVQTLQPYRKFYVEYSPNLALQLMRVGKLQLWLGHIEDARTNLSQAEKIIRVTHGSDFDLYRQLCELLHQCVTESQQLSQSPALLSK